MEYVRFGNTGLQVSRLCLGCMTYGDPAWREWVLDEAAALPFIREAWEAGINFFDTANVYSLGASETILGRAIKELARRDEVVIATKLFNAMGQRPNQKGLSRKHVMEGIDASLKRLGMDYVDLLIIHRFDPDTPIEETVEALSDVVKAGKALYLGASSMWAWQFMKMLGIQRARGLAPFVSMQNYLNLVYREEEREMLPLVPGRGHRRHPLEPARPRLPRRQQAARRVPPPSAPAPTASRTRWGWARSRTTPSSSGSRPWRNGWGSSPRRWRWPGCWAHRA